jgi:tRNA A37 threonylcarbamoyladenosine synthetase subunit TsaC/SUA5/YrdC
VEAVRAVFGDAVDVYVDGGVVPSRASTVVDVSDGELTIVREGPITSAALRSAIGA